MCISTVLCSFLIASPRARLYSFITALRLFPVGVERYNFVAQTKKREFDILVYVYLKFSVFVGICFFPATNNHQSLQSLFTLVYHFFVDGIRARDFYGRGVFAFHGAGIRFYIDGALYK